MTLFLIAFGIILATTAWLDHRYGILSEAGPGSALSFSRIQLAWWSAIILAAFSAVVFSQWKIPVLDGSSLTLLGISGATSVTTLLSTPANQVAKSTSTSAITQVLSGATGFSIGRLQSLILNLVVGIWMIHEIASALNSTPTIAPIPPINSETLGLLGISAATYAGMRTQGL